MPGRQCNEPLEKTSRSDLLMAPVVEMRPLKSIELRLSR